MRKFLLAVLFASSVSWAGYVGLTLPTDTVSVQIGCQAANALPTPLPSTGKTFSVVCKAQPSPLPSPTPSPVPSPSPSPSPKPSPSPSPSPISTPIAPILLTPANGSTLSGPTATFQFKVGSTALNCDLAIGTNQGAPDILWLGGVNCATMIAPGLPTDGSAVYVRAFGNYPGNVQLAADYKLYASGPVIPSPTPSPKPSASPSPSPAPSVTPSPSPTSPVLGSLSAVWANDGGNKVPRDDSPASNGQIVVNKTWNGSGVSIFSGKNEVVNFDLILESLSGASNVSVKFSKLTGPGGASIATTQNSDLFNYVGRNIEVFYVRYLQIKGLSALSYDTYDERHVPKKFQRPWTGQGAATGTWINRQDHDKFYPDIAVPMELVPSFNVAAKQSQSVWVDVFVPKSAVPGVYSGAVQILENGILTRTVPVSLLVRNYSLPDAPTSKTMVAINGQGDIAERYTGARWPNCNDVNDKLTVAVRDKHFLQAHRHKISLIGGTDSACGEPNNAPSSFWIPRLNGQLFTASNGYDGPGISTGNNVYSVGTYSSWPWKNGVTASTMATNSGAWENWFKANSPATERFLYLIDESTDYAQTELWASWTKGYLKGFATIDLSHAKSSTPSLDISASWIPQAPTSWQSVYDSQKAAGKSVYMYNGKRPANGSFATDDDGVALRELAWAQYKKGIDRWFFWEGTYYNDFQGGRGNTNVFQTAATFSGPTTIDPIKGETGWNHTNGDGLLFYPGTDKKFLGDNYNIQGPIASLRLKLWRRGIQDVDYLAMAAAVDPVKTKAIVDRMVPKALWEYGVTDPSDPTWVKADISWSINSDDWEQARKELADIIDPPSLFQSVLELF